MSTVIPNPLSETLERSSARFADQLINVLLANRRFDLESRRISEDERRGALSALIQLQPFLEPGVPIAEMTQLHPLIRRAFPEIDPADVSSPASFGNLVLRKESVNDVINPLLIQRAEELTAGDPKQLNELLDRGISKQIIGVATSPEELAAESGAASLRARSIEAIDKATQNDPELAAQVFDSVGRVALGLDQPVSVQVPDPKAPGGFREITWDTRTAANLSVEIWKFMNQQESLSAKASASTRNALIDQTLKMAENMGVNLSPAIANQLVGSLFTDNPGEAISTMFEATEDPETRAVIQAFTGATVMPGAAFQFLAGQTPEGQAVMATLDAGSQIAEFLPSEDRAEFLDSLTEILSSKIPIARFVKPGLFGRGNELLLPTGTPTGEGVQPLNNSPVPGDTPNPFEGVPPETILTAALTVFQSGAMTQAEIEQSLGPELTPSFRRMIADLGVTGGAATPPSNGGGGERGRDVVPTERGASLAPNPRVDLQGGERGVVPSPSTSPGAKGRALARESLEKELAETRESLRLNTEWKPSTPVQKKSKELAAKRLQAEITRLEGLIARIGR